jgi:hypothetical protein
MLKNKAELVKLKKKQPVFRLCSKTYLTPLPVVKLVLILVYPRTNCFKLILVGGLLLARVIFGSIRRDPRKCVQCYAPDKRRCHACTRRDERFIVRQALFDYAYEKTFTAATTA